MQEAIKVLCVDDEVNVLKTLERLFLDEEYEILRATSGEEGLEILQEEPAVQVVISDYRMPGMNGVEFLREVCAMRPQTVRIVLSGYADTAAVVEAINEGKIYKFIPKPWNDDELKVTVAKAIDLYFLQQENEALTADLTATNEELQLINENLEQLVRERTDEVLFQNRVLRHSQFILDALPVGVVGLDPDQTVVQCNRQAGEILGRDPGGLVGKYGADVLPAVFFEMLAGMEIGQVRKKQVEMDDKTLLVRAGYTKNSDGQECFILVFD